MRRRLIDAIDRQILSALATDSSVSNKTLASRVGLSPSSCLERVRRLRSSGAIRGFHADVDLAAVGINIEALLFVRIGKHAGSVVTDFYQAALQLPETRAAFIITGTHDVLVHVAVPDTAHLKNLIPRSFTSCADVSRVETVMIFDSTATWRLPIGEPDPTKR